MQCYKNKCGYKNLTVWILTDFTKDWMCLMFLVFWVTKQNKKKKPKTIWLLLFYHRKMQGCHSFFKRILKIQSPYFTNPENPSPNFTNPETYVAQNFKIKSTIISLLFWDFILCLYYYVIYSLLVALLSL